MRRSIVVAVALIAALIAPSARVSAALAEQSTALVVNGSFEEGTYAPDALPTGWTNNSANTTAMLTWDNTTAQSGTKSVKLSVTTPTTTTQCASWSQTVNLQAGMIYRLTGWLKTDNVVSANSGATIAIGPGSAQTPPLTGTHDWTLVNMIFYTSGSQVTISPSLCATSGTVWFDTIEIVPESGSMLRNGNFEIGTFVPQQLPLDWAPASADPRATLAWDTAEFHSGIGSVKISTTTPNYATWTQHVAVEPNTFYAVTGWIKTDNVYPAGPANVGASIGLLGTDLARSEQLTGTHGWTQVGFIFNSGPNTMVSVAAQLGDPATAASGTAWFDDIRLATYVPSQGQQGLPPPLPLLSALDQSFTAATNAGASINDCCTFIAQTFTAGRTGELAGVSIDLLSSSNLRLHVAIRTVTSNGTPSATILGETTLNRSVANLSQLITFPQRIYLSAGVQYAIVVSYEGAPPPGGGQSQGDWQGTSGNLYPGGMVFASYPDDQTWGVSYPDIDLHFQTYMALP